MSFLHGTIITGTMTLLLMSGCGLIEPNESSQNINQKPDTVITSGPRQNSEHSYFVHLFWKGEDKDGIVEKFILTVDSLIITTIQMDSIFKFSAANQNEIHSISVAAVDDRGEVDPTPDSISFTAINAEPNTKIQINTNPAIGDTFGLGGIFTIIAEDTDNGPEFEYRFKFNQADDWSGWLQKGVIVVGDTDIVSLNSLNMADVSDTLIHKFSEGQQTFIAQVRDAALAKDQSPAEFPFVASANVQPVVRFSEVSYNGFPFLSDSTQFKFKKGVDSVHFAWDVSFPYGAAFSVGSRYRIDGGQWSDYAADISSLELNSVTPGKHRFEVQHRDLAGTQSDIVRYDYEIFLPTFDQGILVVDDGGGPFFDDSDVDGFYRDLLTKLGVKFSLWDITDKGIPAPKTGMGAFSTILWESEQANFSTLPQNTDLIENYLRAGGNLWITGWKPLQNISKSSIIKIDYSRESVARPPNGEFIWEFLKIARSNQSGFTSFDFIGAFGVLEHPDINIDPEKICVVCKPGLSSVEIMNAREGTAAEAIYTYHSMVGDSIFQRCPVV